MLAHRLRRVRPIKTMAIVNYATSSAATITIPATAQAGDLAVLYDLALNIASYPTLVTPSGWTTILDLQGNNNASSILSYKILEAGDPGATITGMDGNSADAKSLAVFRATPSLAGVTVLESAEQYTSGNPTAQVKTAQSAYPYLVYGVCGGVSGLPSWVAWADATGSHGYQRYGWKFFNDSGASCSVDCGDSGTGTFLKSCILMVT